MKARASLTGAASCLCAQRDRYQLIINGVDLTVSSVGFRWLLWCQGRDINLCQWPALQSNLKSSSERFPTLETYLCSCLLWIFCESRSAVSDCLQPHRLYSPWNSPGQNTGVGGLSLLQGIFPTQRSNPGLPHCRRILYQLSHQESPRILEWVACPFSSRSSQPRNRTSVFCIAAGFFTNWAIREGSTWLKPFLIAN